MAGIVYLRTNRFEVKLEGITFKARDFDSLCKFDFLFPNGKVWIRPPVVGVDVIRHPRDPSIVLLLLCFGVGCVILRFNSGESLPSAILKFLSDERIRFVGFAISEKSDLFPFEELGLSKSKIDVGYLATKILNDSKFKCCKLAELSRKVLGIKKMVGLTEASSFERHERIKSGICQLFVASVIAIALLQPDSKKRLGDSPKKRSFFKSLNLLPLLNEGWFKVSKDKKNNSKFSHFVESCYNLRVRTKYKDDVFSEDSFYPNAWEGGLGGAPIYAKGKKGGFGDDFFRAKSKKGNLGDVWGHIRGVEAIMGSDSFHDKGKKGGTGDDCFRAKSEEGGLDNVWAHIRGGEGFVGDDSFHDKGNKGSIGDNIFHAKLMKGGLDDVWLHAKGVKDDAPFHAKGTKGGMGDDFFRAKGKEGGLNDVWAVKCVEGGKGDDFFHAKGKVRGLVEDFFCGKCKECGPGDIDVRVKGTKRGLSVDYIAIIKEKGLGYDSDHAKAKEKGLDNDSTHAIGKEGGLNDDYAHSNGKECGLSDDSTKVVTSIPKKVPLKGILKCPSSGLEGCNLSPPSTSIEQKPSIGGPNLRRANSKGCNVTFKEHSSTFKPGSS